MHQYLIDTKYATSNIIDLIMHDERDLKKAEEKHCQINEELKLHYERCYTEDMSDDLSPMQVQHEYFQLMKQTEKFLFLENTIVYIDEIEYYIKEVDKILGILMQPFQPVLTTV